MNAVEIEQAVSDLVAQVFDAVEFPYAFLAAFGNKDTTLKRLRAGNTNKSDLGGVLQANNIHLLVCSSGDTTTALQALKASPASSKAKAKFVLATDGVNLEAEDLLGGETLACPFAELPNHFGFFLALAGISTVKQIRESAFDIRATSRLNRLYLELLKDNPDWALDAKRAEMNHFMARLIFCFFAEDTGIFHGETLFTGTIEQMSARDSSNTHEVMSEIFRAMNTARADRANASLRPWADGFPYVNGGLFSGSLAVPRFSKIARTYLLHIGHLDWKQINPDIFGSMIQAVADDAERGTLGMHYTSVPNILKVLDPLFLDDLRVQLKAAADNKMKLLNLRKRISKIRVFDPACGSGNFLVIAYKQLREIENSINDFRGEPGRKSDIPLTNFRGIEIRDFSAEIARLALIIAEFQCDVRYLGQREALIEFLPLSAQNWITCGNALRIDWLSVCPPTQKTVQMLGDDLFSAPKDQIGVDFANEGGETYICGNPPYKGSSYQTVEQKRELAEIFNPRKIAWKNLDYIAGWFAKASTHIAQVGGRFAFVSTNSICQGQQVSLIWPQIFLDGNSINFAHHSFKWRNLASNNAGVTVVVVGVTHGNSDNCFIFSTDSFGNPISRQVNKINPYLVPGESVIVEPERKSISGLSLMFKGNQPSDGGNLILSASDRRAWMVENSLIEKFIYRYVGSEDFINGKIRFCLWINEADLSDAMCYSDISNRIKMVERMRLEATAPTTKLAAKWSHRFIQIQSVAEFFSLIVARVSSERRFFLPVDILSRSSIVSDSAQALYDAPLWNLALIASRIHLVWIATVCGKLKTDFRYSNTLGWNTFPVPVLTEKNKADLTRCAEDILLAREAHFPATIADLYDPETMPENLRAAHERNDETLERIYIGRRFRNDTERLEKLFELYTQMTAGKAKAAKGKR